MGRRQSHPGARGSRPAGRHRHPPACHPPESRTLPTSQRADKAANYLTNEAEYLNYPTALAQGWPIATGIIEGACRHPVKDRMDLAGARWGLHGAEAILKLRALRSNGDFDAYWQFHLAQEHHRTHRSRYADNHIPQAA